MAIYTQRITLDQATKIIFMEEGQFSDVKAIEIAPAHLTKSISALANSDGGDLYIGITDMPRKWKGFLNPESANGHIQICEKLFPLGTDFQYEFLRCDMHKGLVLHIQISKTQSIFRASNGIPYIRRGAQSLPANEPEAIKRLELTKGITSFETEITNAPKESVVESVVIKAFIRDVVPTSQPEPWLKKQALLRDEKPLVAGVLLFSDEPQAHLPKRCGIKVYRYKTLEAEGFREALDFTPMTIEGCLYAQIKEAVSFTKATVESIPQPSHRKSKKVLV